MQDRRRRSGAIHANTCEEYLKKYDSIGKVVLIESRRKKSQSHETFRNFDFVSGEDYQPLDTSSDEIIQVKILLYSPKLKLNEEEFISLMKRVRNRSVTSDGVQQRFKACFDFDFFYREYMIADKNFGLHFWIQNNMKNKYTEIFQKNYYNRFNAAIMFQRDELLESVIKQYNPSCQIKYFPFLDELLIEPLQQLVIEICQLQIKS